VAELSVVIPTFNTAAMTHACCRAVLDSSIESLELIVADDGSTDGTAELLAREVPAVRVERLEANRGFAVAANRGISAASGRIILLLNSDAIVEIDALASMLAEFSASPRLGVAGAQLVGLDGSPQWSGGATPTLAWIAGVVSGAGGARRLAGRRRPRAEPEWVSGAAMAFRREVWAAAGPLDERYLFYCQDIDFCFRARAAGWEVRLLPHFRVQHEPGGTIAPGSALHHDPRLLWPDLLEWGTAHYGRRWGLMARVVLPAVAWIRIGGRMLRRPFRRDRTTSLLIQATARFGQTSSGKRPWS
jgi:GT2 family glycosyltransferase